MIPYEQFGKLRLKQFLPSRRLAQLTNWEFMDRIWVGDALGFSEWLRLEDSPDATRSLAIDFTEFPRKASDKALATIGLPVRPGMNLQELRGLLGEPVREYRFTDDRLSYEFIVQGPPRYNVRCTVLHDGGLTYLVVMTDLNN